MGVDIGIASGITTFGEFGTTQADLTAARNVVNFASRLQGAAGQEKSSSAKRPNR